MSSSPTLRRRRLSRRLRELREERGYTAEWVAKEARRISGKSRGWSESKLNRMENGEWKRLKIDDVYMLLDIYEVTSLTEREACATLARESNQQGWWASYGDILGSGQFVGLESEASSIRTYQSSQVPGLLQTEEYARAVIQATGVVDETELARRVEARMFRKHVFARHTPTTVWAVIDESALLRIPDHLVTQVDSLVEYSERPNIGIQVLPMSRGIHAGMNGQFVIMDFQPPDPPVVYIEAMQEEVYLERPEEVTRYQHIYDHVQAEALSVDESREHMRDLANRRK